MHSVLVQFENPEYNYFTSVSDQTTKESATAYFVGTSFNLGNDENENLQKCESILFFPEFKIGGIYSHHGVIVECIEQKRTGFKGRVLLSNDERIYSKGEIFGSFSKLAFKEISREDYKKNYTQENI